MKITDLYVSESYIAKKIASFDLNDFDKAEADLFSRYEEIKTYSKLTTYEAALLIAANRELSDEIFRYKEFNEPITNKDFIGLLKKVIPVDKTFYRGTERESYDDDHIMVVQSWSMNIKTAKMFGTYIWKTIDPVKGIQISDVAYLYGHLHDQYVMIGDSQAEWLLLAPSKELIDE